MARNIYFYCDSDGRPAGGIRKIYRQVDILNANGFSAYVLHPEKGTRCRWFPNETRVRYKRIFPATEQDSVRDYGRLSAHVLRAADKAAYRAAKFFLKPSPGNGPLARLKRVFSSQEAGLDDVVEIRPEDFLVIPEIYAAELGAIPFKAKKVIFNQNAYYTFLGYPLSGEASGVPYLDGSVEATITVSEQNRRYLQELFPGHRIARIRHGIDQQVFRYNPEKKKQLAFMSRKLPLQVHHIINALKCRGKLRGFDLVPIDGLSETETAGIMRDSLIFLSFSTLEGFGLPPAEAMSCGCIVIGYSGNAGEEYFRPSFSYPVPPEDIFTYITTVEKVIGEYSVSPAALQQKAAAAADFIRVTYSPENETKDIKEFWGSTLANAI